MPVLRFGLIGLGHFGKHYARLLQELPGAALIAVANRSMEAFTVHRDLLPPGILKTANTALVLHHPEIDSIVIATPASTHFAIASEALRAGKHVLIEKPLTMEVAEAEAIRTLANQQNRICLVGYQYVYNDFVLALQRLLPELGAVRYVIGEHQSPGPLRNDIGSFVDAGVHDLSLIYFLFNPGSVTQVYGGNLGDSATGQEDFASAAIRFASGLSAHILTARYAPDKIRKFTVVGKLGIAEINDRLEKNKLRFWRHRYPDFTVDQSSSVYFNLPEPEIPVVTATEPLRNQLEHFIKCVREDARPITNVDFGLKVTQACVAVNARLQRV